MKNIFSYIIFCNGSSKCNSDPNSCDTSGKIKFKKSSKPFAFILFSNLLGVGSPLVRDQLHSRRSNWAEIFHKIVFWVL